MIISYQLATPIIGALGLLVAFWIYRRICKQDAGSGKVVEIARSIHEGAIVFMRREFRLILPFAVIIGALVYIFKSPAEGIAFFMGAGSSFCAGLIGMYAATKANVRTTVAAYQRGPGPALSTAFFGGSVMGVTIASMGLLGIGGLFLFFGQSSEDAEVIHGFAMGASLVAIFFRVGGGIFTKAADVGADLVGKVEAGIPEDDPRNPGVIADNVGDNVGDVAGMGSDLFESYCNAQIATIAIGSTLALADIQGLVTGTSGRGELMYLPLALTSVGLICALIGVYLVHTCSAQQPARALRIGTVGAATLFILAAFGVCRFLDVVWTVWACILTGTLGGVIIGASTEYFTGGKPVRDIARSSETGVATVMISGLSCGLLSVVIPVLTIAAILFVASYLAGLYGAGVAAVGMLATIGITMAIDAYGPVADNAGGIAEMAGLGKKTRLITDELDEVGNTTAAIGKGFAIGAAGLAALAIIAAFVNTIKANHPGFDLQLSDPLVVIGILLGGLCPFLNASITMTAVGNAAHDMIEEIRRQFREIPGLLEGKASPDSVRCVEIATTAALKRMILPALLAVAAPVVVGFGLGPAALAGTLVGVLLSGILLALFMANAGGAWDNAKKYVEKGHFGGKNSESHRALVVGDTVGDPLKDTSGPSMNILINVMAIVSLVIAPML